MTLFSFNLIQKLPISTTKAWDFFANPKNLELITPPWLALKITSEIPEEMYPGMIITYDVSPVLGIPVKWITEITHIDKPNLFVDEQRFGPYRFWHHRHHFRSIPNGIEMQDSVHYVMPFGFFGSLIGNLVVNKKVIDIFNYRYKVLEGLFGRIS
jgi:ligand-binding SRPBCC domain-containing protein